ncbi:MAG: HAMP domain-containing histidine kinase [Oscillospiraceae bacterium]|nr:HAMP domain-containing histidine kinase [Oscillospiraceae bacterium]
MNTTAMRQALEQLNIPYLITDGEFRIRWSNSCLQENYAYLSSMSSLEPLLFGYDKEEIALQLTKEEGPLTLACKLPLLSLTFSLAPLKQSEGGEPEAVVVALTGSPPATEDRESLLTSFNKALRKPIDGLFATVSYLRHRLEDEYAPELLSMTRDCYQMLRACISMTEYNQAVSGTAILKRQYQNLGEFIRQQLDPVLPSLRRSGFELSYSLPEQPLYVPFDSDKLAVVLFSLISNSCYFCEGRNQIRISVLAGENQVRILVTDEGYGIPAEILPQVMDPYFSRGLDDGMQPGLGLGLPLCKVIMEQHGGSIALQSIQDHGTTVALSLPLKDDLPSGGKLQAPHPPYRPERYPKRNVFLSTVLPPEELQ